MVFVVGGLFAAGTCASIGLSVSVVFFGFVAAPGAMVMFEDVGLLTAAYEDGFAESADVVFYPFDAVRSRCMKGLV